MVKKEPDIADAEPQVKEVEPEAPEKPEIHDEELAKEKPAAVENNQDKLNQSGQSAETEEQQLINQIITLLVYLAGPEGPCIKSDLSEIRQGLKSLKEGLKATEKSIISKIGQFDSNIVQLTDIIKVMKEQASAPAVQPQDIPVTSFASEGSGGVATSLATSGTEKKTLLTVPEVSNLYKLEWKCNNCLAEWSESQLQGLRTCPICKNALVKI